MDMETVKLIALIVFAGPPITILTLGYFWHLIWVPLFGNPFNPNNEPLRADDRLLSQMSKATLDNVERNRK